MASKPQKSTSSAIPSTRPSTAIQTGADRLVELVEHEKAHLSHLYHGALKDLEARQKKVQEDHEVQLRSVDRQLQKQEKRIQDLTAELEQTRSHATSVAGDLSSLLVDHEALKASLDKVGLVYIDGRLQFNDKVAHIVDEFVKGAKIQQDALLSSRLGEFYPFERDDALSGPVGPAEFFDVLSGVIEKGRKFAESVEKYQHPRSKLNGVDEPSGPAPQKNGYSDMKGVALVNPVDSTNLRMHAHSVLSDAISP
ncbi:hypothetical protein CVT25_000644 [Psilocybe cyanescens]|uniref:Uncharacterized protein n=1 Tax=Psilocybe cyanescens TaxID=93625 RepID=A0A409X3L3_PSICY|nr:hypothetical protein CVT25_000644 [Psilocybe cyanescens]